MSKYIPNNQKTCPVCTAQLRPRFNYYDYHYYRCPECGLVATLPLPDAESIEAHYRSKFEAGNYQLLRDNAERYKKIYRDGARLIGSYLQRQGRTFAGLKVLDIGTFTGEFLEVMQEMDADVYGLELQSEAVEIANQKLPGRVLKADVHDTIYPQIDFDLITLSGLIEHVVDPELMLGRVFELLKPGGLIMLQTPNSASLLARLMRQYWPPYSPVEHIYIYGRGALERSLTQHGFRGIEYHPHVKWLAVEYIYEQFQNFGPEFYRLLRPFYRMLPGFVRRMTIPAYGGEMIMLAEKPL